MISNVELIRKFEKITNKDAKNKFTLSNREPLVIYLDGTKIKNLCEFSSEYSIEVSIKWGITWKKPITLSPSTDSFTYWHSLW